MNKTILTALALFTFTAQAHAVNLTGSWKGAGKGVDSKGETFNCESVVLTMSQTDASLTVNSEFLCGGQKMQIPGGTMEIRGNELFDKGQKSGSITNSNLSLVAKSKGYTMQSDASFDEKRMSLHSVISVGNNPAPALTFDAALQR
ncbi:MAG TPA: hypothetical protein VIH99_06500 [Bdellovibrionota bacterium]|jgi:hypothetical protein